MIQKLHFLSRQGSTVSTFTAVIVPGTSANSAFELAVLPGSTTESRETCSGTRG